MPRQHACHMIWVARFEIWFHMHTTLQLQCQILKNQHQLQFWTGEGLPWPVSSFKGLQLGSDPGSRSTRSRARGRRRGQDLQRGVVCRLQFLFRLGIDILVQIGNHKSTLPRHGQFEKLFTWVTLELCVHPIQKECSQALLKARLRCTSIRWMDTGKTMENRIWRAVVVSNAVVIWANRLLGAEAKLGDDRLTSCDRAVKAVTCSVAQPEVERRRTAPPKCRPLHPRRLETWERC